MSTDRQLKTDWITFAQNSLISKLNKLDTSPSCMFSADGMDFLTQKRSSFCETFNKQCALCNAA